MSSNNPTDMDQVRNLVDRAIQAATPPGQQVERKMRPESEYSWLEPTPAAGLRAALAVVEIAQQKAYRFVLGLRGEGTSWRQVADLLNIPWSDEYARPERAYELVRGPESSNAFHQTNVYWYCRGPLGCGKYISDGGPYNGYPADDERGHAGDCRRLTAETEAHERELERQEERDRVADKAMHQLAGDQFALSTVGRARWVLGHGGQYQGWSTSETLAVALVLRDDEMLKAQGCSTRKSAIQRVFQGADVTSARSASWLAKVRAAATGETR